MPNIKNVLIHASRYSDSGTPKGWPPTYQDLQMRVKHTSESVEYNLEHCIDHFAELVSQMSKLCEVDSGKCEELAAKVCKKVDEWYKDVEGYKGEHATPQDW